MSKPTNQTGASPIIQPAAADQPHLAGPVVPGIDLTDISMRADAVFSAKEDLITAKMDLLAAVESVTGTPTSLMTQGPKILLALAKYLKAQILTDRHNLAGEYANVNAQLAEHLRQSQLVQVPDMSANGRRQ